MASPYDDLLLAPDERKEWPVERVQIRHAHRGPGVWIQYLALRAAQCVASLAPWSVVQLAAGSLARLARILDRRHTAAARDFVRTALPDLSPPEVERLVLGAWRHLIILALEGQRAIPAVMGARLGEHYDVEVCEGLEELLASGRGCLLITAHVGNWEAMGPAIVAMGFGPCYAIGRVPRNDPLARHFQRARERVGGILIPRSGAMQSVPKVLRAGGSVGMVLDHRARGKPIYVPFFGRLAACDRSAAVLLRRISAPLVMVACYDTKQRDRYRLVFSNILHPEDLTQLASTEIITRVNQELEKLILAAPEQYFWLHDRYKGAPATSEPAESRPQETAVPTHEAPG
ncbi:MAG: lysophospholipid acyltransferase family protein [Planctomycetota bacterium]